MRCAIHNRLGTKKRRLFRMSESHRLHTSKIGAMSLLLILFLFASGCGPKKVPPPPPPPRPIADNIPPTLPNVQKPVIASFSAEPTTIERGQSSLLSWSISGAMDMSIDNGVGSVQSRGQRSVSPANTTTYTLTASGPGGSDTRSVTVSVSTPPG